MSFDEPHRLRFHEWLVELGLAPDTADAILRSMPPDDWHQLATRADLDQLRTEVRGEIGELRADMRSELGDMRSQLGDIRSEMGGLRTDIRTVLLALVGFILTVLLAAGGIAVGFLVG